MTWQRDFTRDGLPVWRGHDSIVNQVSEDAKGLYGCVLPLGVLSVVFVVCFIGGHGGHNDVTNTLGTIVAVIVLPFALCMVWLFVEDGRGGGTPTRQWFTEAWELRATVSHMVFVRGEGPHRPRDHWLVHLDDVSRVETGRSVDWHSSRRFGSVALPTSPHEYQAFLFMNDGSRRVICSINGDRASAATLAQSVRGWVDAAKAERAAQQPRGPSGPREGFDI